MIRFENVNKWYLTTSGERHILRNFTLVLPDLVNVGIMGPNGAGKSTFLRLVSGSEFPNTGRILTNERISWPLGLGGGFQGSLTGLQNVRFVCRIHGLDDSTSRDVVDFVYSFSEIGDYFFMPVKTYSTGMRGRLTFALSMALEFDSYLVDELTSAGDMGFRTKASEAFERMQNRSRILFASHSVGSLQRFCQVGILFRGRGRVDYFPSIDDAIQEYTQMMDERRKNRRARGTL